MNLCQSWSSLKRTLKYHLRRIPRNPDGCGQRWVRRDSTTTRLNMFITSAKICKFRHAHCYARNSQNDKREVKWTYHRPRYTGWHPQLLPQEVFPRSLFFFLSRYTTNISLTDMSYLLTVTGRQLKVHQTSKCSSPLKLIKLKITSVRV